MNNSISLRKRLGLELFRQKEQLIRQNTNYILFFGNVPFAVISLAGIVAVIAKRFPGNPICQKKTS